MKITETLWFGKTYKEQQSIRKLLKAEKVMEKTIFKSFKIINQAIKKYRQILGGREKQREQGIEREKGREGARRERKGQGVKRGEERERRKERGREKLFKVCRNKV